MTGAYCTIPQSARALPEPFTLRISEKDLALFRTLLELSRIGPKTWENTHEGRRHGITHEWLTTAKDFWLNKFDWRVHEDHINSFPNFKLAIEDKICGKIDMHFVALFSERTDAIPIVLLHGWPGSFLEFLPILLRLKNKYTPERLPYHIVVPSLPGFAMSTADENVNLGLADYARVINKLMVSLGFDGYIAQGGDVGAVIAPLLGMQYPECKAVHVNFIRAGPPIGYDTKDMGEVEVEALNKMNTFEESGSAYMHVQGTRPNTISFVLSSNPLAHLAWIGEKFLEWSDEDPSLDTILESATLYWFTSCFPYSIPLYREFFSMIRTQERPSPPTFEKPLGYSRFPKENYPTPRAWLENVKNLVWFREHEKGGHFAALERPDELLDDVEDFVRKYRAGELKV